MMKILGIVFDKILIILFWFGGALLALITFGTCVATLSRYFFNEPIPWMLEIAEYVMLYIPFLAAAVVLKEKGHIKIDLITEHLSSRARTWLLFVESLVGGLTMWVYTVFGASVTFDFFRRGVLSLEYLKLPVYLVIMVIPVGSFLMMIQFFRDALDDLRQINATKITNKE